MSSDMKDARWQMAIDMAAGIGYNYEDFNYDNWQKLLDAGQYILDHHPLEIPVYAAKFRDPNN